MIPLFPEEKIEKKRVNKYTFFERQQREREGQEKKGSLEGDLSAQ